MPRHLLCPGFNGRSIFLQNFSLFIVTPLHHCVGQVVCLLSSTSPTNTTFIQTDKSTQAVFIVLALNPTLVISFKAIRTSCVFWKAPFQSWIYTCYKLFDQLEGWYTPNQLKLCMKCLERVLCYSHFHHHIEHLQYPSSRLRSLSNREHKYTCYKLFDQLEGQDTPNQLE